MSKVAAKTRMLNVLLSDQGTNTFTVKQARRRFGVSNVSARINDLRKEGYSITTNTKTLRNGRKISYYSFGGRTKTNQSFAG